MEPPYHEMITQCDFPGVHGVHYLCFHGEVCCNEGCCQKSPYMILRIWYIWIVLLGIFFFCSGGLKCCKFLCKPQPTRNYTRRNAEQNSRPDFNNDVIDENLWGYEDGLDAGSLAVGEYLEARNLKQNRNSEASPPPYNSLRRSVTVLEIPEPPPQYNTVCKIGVPKTVQVVTSKEEKSSTENRQPYNSADTAICVSDRLDRQNFSVS